MKKILLLGATGSIGLQTIDVIEQHSDEFELVGIAAGNQVDVLNEIIQKHPSIQVVGIGNENKKQEVHHDNVFAGKDAMVQCIEHCDYDLLVNAVVGFRGLKPTLTSLYKGKDVALANKESLVAGGVLVRKALQETNTSLYPIDSEHSAIFQCLQGNKKEQVKRLIITASGGSFRDKTREQLKDVTVEQTLKHPNWSMGKRITVDSATMVNKGFEVIEAHFLFDLDYDQIDTVLHAQSIVHSMVEYNDHAILAQMGSADMRLPIQYALVYPERIKLEEEHPFDATQTFTLDFKKMDFERYPMLKLAYEVGRKEGNLGAVFNGADEQAVELFLDHKISFLQIEESIAKAIEHAQYISNPSYEQLEQSDLQARQFVRELWD
ncbi:MAG: 1-deoxy-D-xylulose-5-phosphate reductoisomerase [Erysipelotrichaceae bacterium]|uniref:1-deoxy-D-xylulose-5-phosphate reductoisomerase n=1 Tax=Floccifex sp. TaxID=2815810 RepID=UPI002A7493FB|nr:1-deoxy-D-xylulose-5-phosphate reductoisomerase [Floccifex sp.]MDD7280935.1 1-deoxy-D-xylulose-5-phosphate reductoisomerase [Erysipelotrichaceae bacterium]MDY2957935.1 1-deoxy-D-xylulose-5-phosphate reductoisomerase [Floccifex sp.]